MLHISRLLVGAMVVLLAAAAIAQTPPTTKNYFPTNPKTKWTYKIQDQEVQVYVAEKTEEFAGKKCFKFDTQVNGKLQASELYFVDTDGVYRAKVKDDKIDPAVKVLALPVEKDKEWQINSRVGGQTGSQSVQGKFKIKDVNLKVSTPKGDFTDVVLVEGIDLDVAGTKTTVKVWFAPNVGIVKLSYKIQDSETVLELKEYEPGPQQL